MKCEKKQDYYLTNFIMINTRFNVPSFIIDKVWAWKYKYFELMLDKMDNNNKINFEELDLTEVTEKRIRAEFHRYWLIRKIKLNDTVWFAWYMNPYLANKSNKQNNKLKEVFKDNNYKAPKWDSYADILDLI